MEGHRALDGNCPSCFLAVVSDFGDTKLEKERAWCSRTWETRPRHSQSWAPEGNRKEPDASGAQVLEPRKSRGLLLPLEEKRIVPKDSGDSVAASEATVSKESPFAQDSRLRPSACILGSFKRHQCLDLSPGSRI